MFVCLHWHELIPIDSSLRFTLLDASRCQMSRVPQSSSSSSIDSSANNSCQCRMILWWCRNAFNPIHCIRVNHCRVNAIKQMHPNRFLQCRLHISTLYSILMDCSVDNGADRTHYVDYYNYYTDNYGALAEHLGYNNGCIEPNGNGKKLNSMRLKCENHSEHYVFLLIDWFRNQKKSWTKKNRMNQKDNQGV